MQDFNSLSKTVVQEIEASSKTSPTAAGQTDNSSQRIPPSSSHIDAINQVFSLFRINYHNQYYKAYGDESLLIQAKKLWLESLSQFAPEAILRGAKKVLQECDFLPTLNRMINACQGNLQEHGLPDAHRAYIEACQAPSPKAAYAWSHAAVYHAGVASDWYFLASSSEKNAFPIFERHYNRLCARVINGEQLAAPNAPALPQTIERPLSHEENAKRMEALRKQFDI